MMKTDGSMTATLAEKIVDWFSASHPMNFPDTPCLKESYKSISAASSMAVIDYLIAERGPGVIAFTPRGLGVPVTLAQRLCEDADRFFAALRSASVECPGDINPSDKSPSDGAAVSAEAGSATVPHEPSAQNLFVPKQRRKKRHRAGPRVWSVCDERLLSERIAAMQDRAERRRLLLELQECRERLLPTVRQSHLDALHQLRQDFPNFSVVIDAVETDLLFARHLGLPIHIRPTLLLGPPGIGKTEFMRRLAKVLSMNFEFLSGAEISASWILTGTDSRWRDAGPGIVSKGIIGLPKGKGLMFAVDEIDKVADNGQWPLDRALLGLLEAGTAKAFKDEFLDCTFDARPISWVLTANYLERVKPELVSRLRLFEIETPTAEQMPAVIRSIDESLRRDQPMLAKCFFPLPDEVIDLAQQIPPRQLRTNLLAAYAKAVRDLDNMSRRSRQKLALQLHHLSTTRPKTQLTKQPIGFVT